MMSDIGGSIISINERMARVLSGLLFRSNGNKAGSTPMSFITRILMKVPTMSKMTKCKTS